MTLEDRDESGMSLLMIASKCDFRDIVLMLLKQGADVDARDVSQITQNNGNTAMHYACALGYKVIVSMLTDHGADETLLNKKTLTPWEGI